jgi:two-component system, cell cycle response regulator
VGARILLAEDNEHNQQLMTYLLTAYGHQVTCVSGGEEAVAAARRDRPDLVVMDIQLRGETDGYQALDQLRADPALRLVPVVAVTALAMVGDRGRALAAGFTDHLTKPIDPRWFVTAIEGKLPAPLRGTRPVRASRADETGAGTRHPQRPGGATVLVVADRPTNVALVRSILEPSGYEVATASTVGGALDATRRDRPDLVLADVRLGTEHGSDLLRRLQAAPELSGIPFAFITTTAVRHDAHEPATHLEVIRQPIEPDQLLALVARLLRPRTRS